MKDQKLIDYIRSIRESGFATKLAPLAGSGGVDVFWGNKIRTKDHIGNWAHCWSDIIQAASEVLNDGN